MKCTFELTPAELGAAIKDGTLAAFIAHANEIEKLGAKATATRNEAAAMSPITKDPAAQSFNPTVTAPPVTPAAAGFNPMAIPAAPVLPIPVPAIPFPVTAPPQPGQGVTIDQVRATLAPLVKAGKELEIAALFKEFGAAKMTEVKPEHYAALIAKAATL